MTFYSLPNEIHMAIIELVFPVHGCHYYKETWKAITHVCQLWRKLSQRKYLDYSVHWMMNGHFSIKPHDLSLLTHSHATNSELWGTRNKIHFRIETIDDIREIWQWLGTNPDWNQWLKKICLDKRPSKQLFLPGSLYELPTIDLEGVSFRNGQTLSNLDMLRLLRSLPKLKEIVRPVLIEANTCLASGEAERRDNYLNACLFVQQLATSNITTLDLTYKRTYFPPQDGPNKPPEPVFPLLGDLESSGAFFRALCQLSQQLKVFFYRGRGSDEFFRGSTRRGTWTKLEYMMIEFDVLDAAGFYWVDFNEDSDSEEESEDSEYEEELSESGTNCIEDECNHFEGLDNYDPSLDYVPRKQRWDSLFLNVAQALEHMPKVALLVVGINPDIVSQAYSLEDCGLDWDLCGLAFAPHTPKTLRIHDVPKSKTDLRTPLPSKNKISSLLEMRIAHTDRYSPSDATVLYLKDVFGDVGFEKVEGFKDFATPAMINWEIC